MSTTVFRRESTINVPVGQLRDWHFRSGAIQRLTPPWENAEVIEAPAELVDGARAIFKVGVSPFRLKWVAEHEITDDGFIDRQLSGPFASWVHHHRFEAIDEKTSRLVDEIHYALPLGKLGSIFGGAIVEKKLDRMFTYRHETTRLDLERNPPLSSHQPLTIVITGATGMVGRELCAFLTTQGHKIRRVTRHPEQPGDILWDLENQFLDLRPNLHVDAVIHLAGENIGEGKWTVEKKRRILESRQLGTALIAKTIADRFQKPSVLVSMSGSGFYPTGAGERHDEGSPSGEGFLSQVCREWERAADPAREGGIRVVHPRMGVVLSPSGGALAKMLPLFKLGLGGRLGSGKQRMSWVAIDDVVEVLYRCILEEGWEGPLNLTAPDEVTNQKFTKTLGAALHRPTTLPAPEFALKKVFGEMAEETLLADIAVAPGKLEKSGYTFRYPNLHGAFRHLLGANETT